MKQPIPFIAAVIFFLSFANALHAQSTRVELIPYREVYADNIPFDTISPNGMYMLNLVNRDTSDHNLYISFGTKEKRKIHCIEGALDLPICGRPRFAYATRKSIALISDCDNLKGLLLLTLYPDFVRVERYTPLYINQIDTILFVQDYMSGKDKFLLTNLDNDLERRQDVFLAPLIEDVINHTQKAFGCQQISNCFEDIHYDKGNLSVTFLAKTLKDEKPEPLTKTIKVKWK